MILRRRVWISLIGVILIILGACQPMPVTPGPVATQTGTATAVPPSQAVPTLTPEPSLSPTPSFSQNIDLRQLKGVHIQFWYPYLDATASALQSLVNTFNQQNSWGIHVDTYTLGNSSELYRQVLDAIPGKDGSSSSGVALPDVVIANPEQAASWQAVNPLILDLAPYMNDGPLGLSSRDFSDYFPVFKPQDNSGDLPDGIPAEGNLEVLFYNTTWAQKLGFKQPPTTPEEFHSQACRAATANRQDGTIENDGTGGWLINTDAVAMLAWIDAFNGQVQSQPEGRYTFNSPDVSDAFTFLKNLVTEGCAWSGLDPLPYDYFVNHEALFYSGDLEDILAEQAAFHTAGNPDTWTVIPYPSLTGSGVTLATAAIYYIFQSNDIRQMAAWLFVRWMASPQNQAEIVKADGSFPLRQSEISILADYQAKNPQWTEALQFADQAQAGPVNASWRQVSSILEDASQQLFQPETIAAEIPGILSQIDSMAVELSKAVP